MRVEKVISNAMKRVDSFIENEEEEFESFKKHEMSDPELTDKLSRMLIKEINRDE